MRGYRRRHGTLVLLVVGVAEATGCAGEDSADGRATEPVLAELEITLGDDESLGPNHVFGSVASVALDARGRIYVADRTDSRIRVFDSTGSFVQYVGHEGEGPGEFEVPLDIGFSRNEDLWVRDLHRIQKFVARSADSVPDSVARVQRLTGYASTSPTRAVVVDSLYYSPGYFFPLEGGSKYFYEIYGPGGVVDTLAIPVMPGFERLRMASYRAGRLDRASREVIASLSRAPFEAIPVWQLTRRGTLLVSSGADDVIRELDRYGQIVGQFELPFRRASVPPGVARDSLAALGDRLASLAVPLGDITNVSDYVLASEVPDSLPTALGIHEGSDGRVWVEVWPRVNGAEFLAFTPDGAFEGHLRLPVSLGPSPPHFGPERVAAVTPHPVTGVETVRVFTFDF